jgi:mannan endo-1,4-beta-mannosidase
MLNRRSVLAATGAALAARTVPGVAAGKGPRSAFVRREGMRLLQGNKRYAYAGANMWYAAYLGAAAPVGDPDRLQRELDALAAMGVRNLRILASSERSPLTNSLQPAFRDRGAGYNELLLRGIDRALAEMGKRGLTGVLYLANFWEWSGGMMTYMSWVNGGDYINMGDPAHPWPEFADRASAFYSDARAVALYRDYVRAVVGRTNSVTGVRYRDDPTIMAWQLANEPRPGGSEAAARANMPAFRRWVSDTTLLIRSLDPSHLVSTGSEGLMGCVEDEACVIGEHAIAGIDYLTVHIWPLNWRWIEPKDVAGTWDRGEAKVRASVADHVRLARQLNKPLVIEEFGFARDEGYDPGTPTVWRDRFYALIYELAQAAATGYGPVAGTNFWAWAGSGRSGRADHHYSAGPAGYVGDPPHEPQGWYSVFDSDLGTRKLIASHARAMARVR